MNSAMKLDLASKKEYWEEVYQNRSLNQSGWYEPIPESSLKLIESSGISKNDSIIDIGGGDSLLVDHLLSKGFKNITVLDISEKAIEKAKIRLGTLADNVKWICSDILDFQVNTTYNLWHDRACLHFLTVEGQVSVYQKKVNQGLAEGGSMILGAFSKSGPKKCSGLPIQQYDSTSISRVFSGEFKLMEDFETVHRTPSKSAQNYVFCRLIKNNQLNFKQ